MSMSSFPDSFTQIDDDSMDSVPHQEEDVSSYAGYDPSQQFEAEDSTDDVFASQSYTNGGEFGQDFGGSDGPVLPTPAEMEPEEGFALREWRRLRSTRIFYFF